MTKSRKPTPQEIHDLLTEMRVERDSFQAILIEKMIEESEKANYIPETFANGGFTGRGKLSDFAQFQNQGCYIRTDSARKAGLPSRERLEELFSAESKYTQDFVGDIARSLVAQGISADSTIELVPGDPGRNEMIIRATPNKKEGE